MVIGQMRSQIRRGPESFAAERTDNVVVGVLNVHVFENVADVAEVFVADRAGDMFLVDLEG